MQVMLILVVNLADIKMHWFFQHQPECSTYLWSYLWLVLYCISFLHSFCSQYKKKAIKLSGKCVVASVAQLESFSHGALKALQKYEQEIFSVRKLLDFNY